MNNLGREFFAFLGALVMLAVIGVLVSKNATTPTLVNETSSLVNTGIATAAGPVTGYTPGPPIYADSAGNTLTAEFEGLGSGGVL